MTTDAKSIPKWRRALSLALKIYAGLCTLLITAYLVLVLWSNLFPAQATQRYGLWLKSSYDDYVSKESPKRGHLFYSLATALSAHATESPVSAPDMVKYLGKPDYINGTLDSGTAAYVYEHAGITNRYVLYARLREGKLTHVGFNNLSEDALAKFQMYPK